MYVSVWARGAAKFHIYNRFSGVGSGFGLGVVNKGTGYNRETVGASEESQDNARKSVLQTKGFHHRDTPT